MEARGWGWATGLLGEKTPAVFLSAPEGVQSPDILRLINGINKGNFGKINAGYGFVGMPLEATAKPDDA